MKDNCKTCRRRSCKFFEAGRRNNCNALAVVYDNDKECKFFKKKENDKE